MNRIFTIITVLVLCISALYGKDCVWDRDSEMPQYPPLIMDQEMLQSVLPTYLGNSRVIQIPEGSTVILACSQTEITALGKEVVEATCEGDKTLLIDGKRYSLEDLGCEKRAHEEINRDIESCGQNEEGQLHLIGFDAGESLFYPLIEVCFEPVSQILLYATHLIRGAYVSASDTNPSRPSFKSSSGFYTVSPSHCYETATQAQLMEDLIGNTTMIDLHSGHYFARGHMAADADFFSEMERDATYYYLNVVPQWQYFNNGNWKKLEYNVRELAEKYGRDFQVWTGPWGVLQLEDTNNSLVDIYLGLSEQEAVIPIPQITWKVIFDHLTNRAVAVVVVNNPFIEKFPTPICKDITDSILWIDFDTTDVLNGATYCCSAQDLHKVVPNAPSLSTAGILTE